jgi:hypothetical protein
MIAQKGAKIPAPTSWLGSRIGASKPGAVTSTSSSVIGAL